MLNRIITPAQFSGSSLMPIAVEALRAENSNPQSSISILTDEDSQDDASTIIAKLFSHGDGGFETCRCMNQQFATTKIMFLQVILKTCKENPLVVMEILKRDFDEAKTELAAARSEIAGLQLNIRETEEEIKRLCERVRVES